ncbi:shikimate kinase [Arthrobacter halodurans]|uniref:Shikimate kinase n=1 Tax=Arthrobacter halodurans TaxID=516699 RepID=A0ABV4UMP4_9MICC
MPGGIFLIGPMASGKTAVGRELARLTGAPFIDTDAEVTGEHGSIAGIFARGGEPAFRAVEARALRRAADAADRTGAVVATGGGAVLEPANRRLLSERFTVYLETDLETVWPRISGSGGRPLLAGDPLQRWTDIFAAREPFYRECSTLTIDARAATPAELAATIDDAHRRRAEQHGGTP